jgi:uncharacterized protein YceH (UPF0502 family)
VELSPEEIRVVGCLVEKQLTTPHQYPLTLNALTLACNQSSNRDPVVVYDEAMVEATVTNVKTKGLARFVHPSHGRSALRYRHSLDEAIGIDVRPLALLAVLMLRGPQTPGELRARSERMADFADSHEVVAELEALAARTAPLVVRLPRAPGQKEDRYAHLLGGVVDQDVSLRAAAHGPGDLPPPSDSSDEPAALAEAVAALREEVAELRRGLEELRGELQA